jgi:hypothetical protein
MFTFSLTYYGAHISGRMFYMVEFIHLESSLHMWPNFTFWSPYLWLILECSTFLAGLHIFLEALHFRALV